MFNKAIVATELSPASEGVLECLKGLMSLGTRKIVLVHAMGIRHLETIARGMVQFVEPYLLKQKAFLEAQGFETQMVLAPGVPVIEVDRLAQEYQASLIVVGSHGATFAHEMLIGGTALGIVHHATVPVLVVRLNEVLTGRGWRERCGRTDQRKELKNA